MGLLAQWDLRAFELTQGKQFRKTITKSPDRPKAKEGKGPGVKTIGAGCFAPQAQLKHGVTTSVTGIGANR